MNSSYKSFMILSIITMVSMSCSGAVYRTLPHTVVFRNTSDKEQLISVNSEYTMGGSAGQSGRDLIWRPLAPGAVFVYGGKRYVFTRLEVRLNPTRDTRFFINSDSGIQIVGLAESASIVTIFDDDAYTVRNKESFSRKLWKERMKMKAAKKAMQQQLAKAGDWVHDTWDSAKDTMSHLVDRTKEGIQSGKEQAGHMLEHVSEKLRGAKERAKEGLTDAKDQMKERAKDVGDKLSKGAHEAKEGVKERVSEAADTVAREASDKKAEVKSKLKDEEIE